VEIFHFISENVVLHNGSLCQTWGGVQVIEGVQTVYSRVWEVALIHTNWKLMNLSGMWTRKNN